MPIIRDVLVRTMAAYDAPIDFVLPAVDHLRESIEEAIQDWPIKPRLVSGEDEKYLAFRQARAALAASGTVTLELALAHVPMVVGYRVGAVEGQIRHVIHVPSIVLPNLIIGENLIPERIQADCNCEQLTDDLLPLLTDTAQRKRQMIGFTRLDAAMEIGESSPSKKAADLIFGMLDRVTQ
jgi:lipid-A-disaccharide synthase